MAAYGALVSLMHIIENLENHPRPPISLQKNQVDLLTQKITFLQQFLEGYNPLVGYSAEAVLLESRITDAAYVAEDVIESHIVDSVIEVKSSDGRKARKARNRKPVSSDASVYQALETVIEDMALIQKEAVEIKQTVSVSVGVQVKVQHQLHSKSTSPDSLGSSSSSPSSAQQSGMVGADDVLLQMKDKLRSDGLALQIIPIVGMAGLGKTTLATNIYQHPLITEHFHFRAWATISQEYSIREILVQLLKQLDKEVGKDVSEGELGDMLHMHLFGRRYLVILDDMWNIGAWEGVKMFLPNNKNGGRIVVTTRLSNLASKLPNSTNSLEMKLLDDAKSWDLLTRTVYGDKDCPVELEGIGKKIAKSCKGLPLSIVVVGGLLAKSNRRREFWEHIEENINSIVNSEDNERCLKILGMSYKHLPVYLKPCFLFMEVFVEDEVIRVSRLIKLWVAEGVVKPVRGKSLEEIAKEYLVDLIGRNLIMIHELGSIGSIKYCKIHDLVRDLCLREAQRDRSSQLRRMVVSSTLSRTVALEYRSRRLMSVVRTLMWHLGYGIPTPHNFRLLRILDVCGAQSWRLGEDQSDDFLHNMCQLVNSRFLSYTISKDRSLHDSVWRFWNLQTIIAYESVREYPPPEIWSMPHIRHVKIRDGLSLPDPPDHNSIVLGSLLTLGTVRDFECSREVAKRIPNIKKLVLKYRSLDCDRSCLGNLYSLSKLESFTCLIDFKMINGSLINFPHSVKKVTLSMEDKDSYWEEIFDKIGELPRLQKLKLSWGSFKEGQWETSEGQFCSLKSLAISFSRDLQVWKIESSHFPCLERLRLHEVSKLEEIPLEFADISTLTVVEVDCCSDPVVVSAKRILEEQKDLYGEEASLHVQVRLSDYRNNKAAMESLASPNFHVG